MRKLNLVLVLVIGLTISSCSSEDKIENIATQSLVSITKDNYIGNNTTIYSSSKFNFDNNKLINIQYADGSYDEIDYEGDLMKKIEEFGSNNNLEWTTTYTYDISKRLLRKKVVPSATNTDTDVSRQKDIIYDGNSIQTTLSWSDGGLQKSTISINEENVMIDDKLFSPDDRLVSSYIFNYSDENLSKVVSKDSKGTTEVEVTYNYLDKEASGAYTYNKYLFGNEWKNNSSLNKQFGLGHSDSFEISKNYIKDYSFSHDGLSFSQTVTFDYEFDSDDKIISQTRIITESTGSTYKTITTYEYQQ